MASAQAASLRRVRRRDRKVLELPEQALRSPTRTPVFLGATCRRDFLDEPKNFRRVQDRKGVG